MEIDNEIQAFLKDIINKRVKAMKMEGGLKITYQAYFWNPISKKSNNVEAITRKNVGLSTKDVMNKRMEETNKQNRNSLKDTINKREKAMRAGEET